MEVLDRTWRLNSVHMETGIYTNQGQGVDSIDQVWSTREIWAGEAAESGE